MQNLHFPIRFSIRLAAAGIAVAACNLAAAQAAEAEASPVTGNIAITSNYISRGFTQTWGHPAIQGGFDYAHPSGLYAGTWLSSISGTEFRGGNLEWDVYGGYGGTVGPLGYTTGLYYYAYPGTSSPLIDGRKYNYGELKLGLSYQFASLNYFYVVTKDWFGTVDNGRGSSYLDLSVNPDLGNGYTLLTHVGIGEVRHASEANWKDYKIGVSKAFDGGWTLTGAFTKATDKNDYWTGADFSKDSTGNTYTKDLGKGVFVLTLGKTF